MPRRSNPHNADSGGAAALVQGSFYGESGRDRGVGHAVASSPRRGRQVKTVAQRAAESGVVAGKASKGAVFNRNRQVVVDGAGRTEVADTLSGAGYFDNSPRARAKQAGSPEPIPHRQAPPRPTGIPLDLSGLKAREHADHAHGQANQHNHKHDHKHNHKHNQKHSHHHKTPKSTRRGPAIPRRNNRLARKETITKMGVTLRSGQAPYASGSFWAEEGSGDTRLEHKDPVGGRGGGAHKVNHTMPMEAPPARKTGLQASGRGRARVVRNHQFQVVDEEDGQPESKNAIYGKYYGEEKSAAAKRKNAHRVQHRRKVAMQKGVAPRPNPNSNILLPPIAL